jgi:hypothetical protein
MRVQRKVILSTLAVAALSLSAGLAYSETPTLKAVRVERGPRLDGSLQDEVWRQAVPFAGFRMVFPRTGEPSEKTEIRILCDESNLYIGVYCYDSAPSEIAANTMAHDADDEGESDDIVKVLLDPFQDKRTAYIFFVNPRGARSEGLAFGEHSSLDWDGIWDARSRIQSDGWTCVMKIPFKTISFKAGLSSWGINVERYIPRKLETIRLAGVSQDNHFYNPALAAPLEGIRDVKLGYGVTFKPYGAGRAFTDHFLARDTDYEMDGGFDIYKNFTPNFVGAFSYNTDFAETEVDERRINLTRFPLLFPEKRTFFLEGSEIFNFGTTGGAAEYEGSFIPFFSRRIGLFEGNQIPVIFGTKLFGRLGSTNLALLDVRTDKAFGLSRENFIAGRISQNVLEESKVGLIFTNGSPSGGKNTLAGFDLNYQTSKFLGNRNFSFGGWYVYNWNEAKTGKHQGFGVRLDYPNDLWDIRSSFEYYGDSLNPGVGYLRRPGVQTYSLGFSFQPRPEKGFVGRLVRQFFCEAMADFCRDLNGRLETREMFFAPLNFRTESGEHFEFNIGPTRDVLPFDFEVADGVFIPQGPYDYTRYEVQISTASHRPWMVDLEHKFGSFYSGHLNETELGLGFKMKGYATLDVRADLIRGNLPQGRFKENVYELKADFFFLPPARPDELSPV